MNINQYISSSLLENSQTMTRCLNDVELQNSIAAAADLMIQSITNGNKILLVGNGGSAADCQHFAAELVGRFRLDRDGLPAVALTTDTSILTSIANDYGYDQVFARQVLSIGKPNDLLIAISTSGQSASILNAMAAARVSGIKTVAFTSNSDSAILSLSDIAIQVPDNRTAQIQQVHLVIYHLLCDVVEQYFFAQ